MFYVNNQYIVRKKKVNVSMKNRISNIDFHSPASSLREKT